MKEQLEEIRARALSELSDSATVDQIENVRVRVLGRSGELTEIMRGMGKVPAEERPTIGRLVNQIKAELEGRIEALNEKMQRVQMERSLGEARIDVTLPGMRIPRGWLHPVTQSLERMLRHLHLDGFRSRSNAGRRGRF